MDLKTREWKLRSIYLQEDDMPNYGHEFDLPQGGEVRVRRCFDDINDLDADARVKEVVEFTV